MFSYVPNKHIFKTYLNKIHKVFILKLNIKYNYVKFNIKNLSSVWKIEFAAKIKKFRMCNSWSFLVKKISQYILVRQLQKEKQILEIDDV